MAADLAEFVHYYRSVNLQCPSGYLITEIGKHLAKFSQK